MHDKIGLGASLSHLNRKRPGLRKKRHLECRSDVNAVSGWFAFNSCYLRKSKSMDDLETQPMEIDTIPEFDLTDNTPLNSNMCAWGLVGVG